MVSRPLSVAKKRDGKGQRTTDDGLTTMPSLLQQLENNEAVLLMYLADELPTDDLAEVEQMLANDPGLRAELESLRAAHATVLDGLHELDHQSLPAVSDAVVHVSSPIACAGAHATTRSSTSPGWPRQASWRRCTFRPPAARRLPARSACSPAQQPEATSRY